MFVWLQSLVDSFTCAGEIAMHFGVGIIPFGMLSIACSLEWQTDRCGVSKILFFAVRQIQIL